MKSMDMQSFSFDLLDWYHHTDYDFPWRHSNDPYAIWLSEVMLQQTRISTVLPYYQRWISTLPNLRSVADTHIDDILKLWEGLGYYHRARNFHRACQIIIQEYRGKIPPDHSEFSKLPGVGPYIAAAVMSIAFNIPLPAIDGNAVRVVSRLNAINTHYPQSKKQIISLLNEIITPDDPGGFNQAIMDLGREICTSSNPSCNICPVSLYCISYVNNIVDKYPLKVQKSSRPHYYVAVGIILNNNQILISKRRESGLLGGLWEFPGGKIKINESGSDCVIREVQEELNVSVVPKSHLKQIQHAYSHFSITMDAYLCQYRCGRPKALRCADFRWVYPHEIQKLAFPSANHKLFDSIDGVVCV